MTDAFSAGDADFTKMIDTGSHGENLYIGSILQGTRIEVNEAGAKAMSFTKVGADSVSAPVDNVEFTVGSPISVFVRHPGRHTIIHRCGAQPRRSRWRKLILSWQSVN